MSIYPDTSVIISAFVNEPGTAEASRRLLAESPEVLVSWWTLTEITSAVGVRVRVGTFPADQRAALLAGIRTRLHASTTIVTPLAEDFAQASTLMDQSSAPLRGGDALHLAIAARQGTSLWTLDEKMMTAGEALGLDVRLLA